MEQNKQHVAVQAEQSEENIKQQQQEHIQQVVQQMETIQHQRM